MIQTALGTYDPELQMFVEPERDLNEDILAMWRKRVQNQITDDGEWFPKQESN